MPIYRIPSNRRPVFILTMGLVIALIALITLLFLGMPAILSTQWGQAKLLHYANQQIPGKIAVENLQLSWLGPQAISNATLQDPEGHSIATLKHCVIRTPLYSLLWKKGAAVDAEFQGFNIQISENPKGYSNLHRSLGLQPFALSTPLSFRDVEGKVHLTSLQDPIVVHLEGVSIQDSIEAPFTLEVKSTLYSSENQLAHLDIWLQCDQLSGQATLLINEKSLQLDQKTPAEFKVALTPARFKTVQQLFLKDPAQANFALTKEAQIKLTVAKLNIPVKNKEAAWTEAAFDATFAFDRLALLESSTQQSVEFDNIQGRATSKYLAKRIAFDLTARQNAHQGSLVLNGSVQELLNRQELSSNASLQFKALPSAMLIDKHHRLHLQALLGATVDGQIRLISKGMNGSVQASVMGSNGQAVLDATLKDGWITLNKPFEAEVTATPQLGQIVLQEIVPLLSGLMRSDDRMRLTVDSQGFSVPLKNPSLENLKVGQLTIQLGKVDFSNEGQLGKILDAVKASSADTINVWFTPIYISMDRGLIDIQRFDMLAMNRYPVAAWGKVNIPADKIDMIIGLSGKSLQKAITIPLPDSETMMQFPLQGSIKDASIDKKKIAAKIAALTAMVAGGPPGLVLGAVLGVASGSFSEDKTPPPTTQPFPWASTIASSNTSEGESAVPEKKKSKNPMKSLEKGASEIIQGFFR